MAENLNPNISKSQDVFYIVFKQIILLCGIVVHVWCLSPIQVADSLRSHGLPVRLISFMENTPHGIRRTLSKLRKMREIRSEFPFRSSIQKLETCRACCFGFLNFLKIETELKFLSVKYVSAAAQLHVLS